MVKDKIYFASDFHLGTTGLTSSEEREKKIISWLDYIRPTCKELYLVGDVFDYWFEYKEVIPKGYLKFISKLAQMKSEGTPIYLFTGNHDMWLFDYFEKELDIPVMREPIFKKIFNHTFLIGHGDGLGPGDKGYKFIKKVFSNKICQWLFARIHPNLGLLTMRFFSKSSRNFTSVDETIFKPNTEWLIQFIEQDKSNADYYVFGHRHLPIDYQIQNHKGKYINLGDWLYYCSYGVYDGSRLSLAFYDSPYEKVYGNEK